VQSFRGVVKPFADTRPAWKVLRVLGNLLGLQGFQYETSEAVRDEALAGHDARARPLSNAPATPATTGAALRGLERVADVLIYGTDSLVRRSAPLQATRDALPPVVGVPSALWRQLGLRPGAKVRVTQGEASAVLPAAEDATLAPTAVRIAAAHPTTASLGAMFGAIGVEAA
jgi:NADH-quinone oxidoreductase subunit G